MSEQLFAEPVPYFESAENLAAADRTELDRLRAEVKEADAVAARATDWTARTRAEQDAKSLARQLQAAEFNARLVQQGGSTQRAGQQAGGQPSSPGYVVSDCGTAYAFVANTQKRAPRAAAAAAGTEQQFYAEPTPPTIHNA